MAGRPRTMLKRVARILELHQKLTEELRNLGKHHMPAPGERWDFAVPGGIDPIPPSWRQAVFASICVDDYIDDSHCFLELKIQKAEQSAMDDEAANNLDDEDDGQGEPDLGHDAADAESEQGKTAEAQDAATDLDEKDEDEAEPDATDAVQAAPDADAEKPPS